MKKESYDFESKRLYRQKLKEFIVKHYPHEINRRDLRVACFPGHEGLEVREVYLPLGIKPTRIYGIEQNAGVAKELSGRNLGIQLYQGSAQEFFKNTATCFDIINLDFQSQFGNEEIDTFCTITHNERLRKRCIFGTNFYGSRESEERKEEYHQAVNLFEDGGNIVRVGRSISDPLGRKVVESLEGNRNNFNKSSSLEDIRDTTISTRLRYGLSANSVREGVEDLKKDPFLLSYYRSIRSEEFPSLEEIMNNPEKYVSPVNTLTSIKDFYIMRVFQEAFPDDGRIQASLHAFWEVLQLRRPYFINDFVKGKYISDTGSPMLFDFIFAENLKELTANIQCVFDRAEETQSMRFTFREPVSARKTNELRPLSQRESLLFALNGGDPYKVYQKGGLFFHGSQKIFWKAMDEIGEALINEMQYVVAPRKELRVPDKVLIPPTPEILKLPERMNYLPREMYQRLPSTHKKALEYFGEDVSRLPERKQRSLEKAFLFSRFEEQIQQPLEATRFYAFLDDLRARILRDKPMTSRAIDECYATVRDAASLVETIPFSLGKTNAKKNKPLSEEIKQEIRDLRVQGFDTKDIYDYLIGKGVSITPRQCGATAAWMHPSFTDKKKKRLEILAEAAA